MVLIPSMTILIKSNDGFDLIGLVVIIIVKLSYKNDIKLF